MTVTRIFQSTRHHPHEPKLARLLTRLKIVGGILRKHVHGPSYSSPEFRNTQSKSNLSCDTTTFQDCEALPRKRTCTDHHLLSMIQWRRCAFWGLQILLTLLPQGGQCWIPPHPDFATEKWEPVHGMRRRLGLEYNYSTQVIAEEMCRYLSEEDCEDADLSMKMHIASQKRIQHQSRRNPNIGKIKVRQKAAIGIHKSKDV